MCEKFTKTTFFAEKNIDFSLISPKITKICQKKEEWSREIGDGKC